MRRLREPIEQRRRTEALEYRSRLFDQQARGRIARSECPYEIEVRVGDEARQIERAQAPERLGPGRQASIPVATHDRGRGADDAVHCLEQDAFREVALGLVQDCLLYTSDAADE